MKKIIWILGISVNIIFQLPAQSNSTLFSQPPEWSKHVIWYQVFLERFYNGDKSNDPKPENINTSAINSIAPKDWSITRWTSDWYAPDKWMKETGMSFNPSLQFRRYGGDLQGLLEKLDYLQDLGVTAIFINPLNDAPSLHKYDARNYHHIDVNFGPDPSGDNKIIASENPSDPTTWKWTSADKLFLKLVDELHKRHMKIIMDYSWNHTGTTFWAWLDILKNQDKSPYKDWYDIKSFDDPSTPQNEFAYNGWLGVQSLPEIKKINITTTRLSGHAYEGDINAGMKKHIYDVTKRWLAPGDDTSKGIDGFRMDVADQVGLAFWREFRKYVRSIQPDAYLVGEIWWEAWPDHLMNPVPYTSGDVFDAVMFYQAYKPARYFFAKNNYGIDAAQFKDSLELEWNRLLPANRDAMMNVSSTHDAPRLLSDFYNPNKYKYHATPSDDPSYKTGKPDEETYQRVRLYIAYLFTTIGCPQIFNGEEMGMWGADDPHERKPLWWKELRFDPERRNNFQPGNSEYDPVSFNQQQFDWYQKLCGIRNSNLVLSSGDFTFIKAEGKTLAYKRSDGNNEIIVLFNLDLMKKNFDLAVNTKYTDLLRGKVINTSKVELPSLSVMILKKER